MIDITNKEYKPSLKEIDELIDNPLFQNLCEYINTEYKADTKIEYSGDKILLGWNVKFRKAGRALFTLYPKKNYFTVLVVVGRKEKETVETLLPQMSEEIREIYENTIEGMGQRWLLIDLKNEDDVYRDVLSIIRIRRYGNKK
ncbi:MAG: DUF3788 domain-containing protein [Methanocorpusculum sp.]|nr:DUF3788 domain-containing protein [Methanocorpusculum sp.]